MGISKVPFKTNLDQTVVWTSADQTRRRAYQRRRAKPIRTTRIDIDQERNYRIKWTLTWVLIFPLGILAVSWFLLLLIDLFFI